MIAQEFGKQYPSELAEFVAMLKDTKQAGFDSTQNVLAQVSTIVARQDAQIAEIAAATAAVAAQNVTIAAQVAAIATLVGQQVTGAVGNNNANLVALTTGAAAYAPVTFTVPAGFTSAQVLAVSAMYTGPMATVYLYTQIAGGNGIEMNGYGSGGVANVTSTFARTLTGLTGGSTFTVQSLARGNAGTAAWISTSATVTYFR